MSEDLVRYTGADALSTRDAVVDVRGIAAAESGGLEKREGEYITSSRRITFAPITGADQT